MPLDAPASFGGLAALIRSTAKGAPATPSPAKAGCAAAPATPAAPAVPTALPAASWAVGRNWAMRFLGVPPAIALLEAALLPLVRQLQRLLQRLCLGSGSATTSALPALPVRHGLAFKAAKDRRLSARLGLWNGVFMVTVLLTVLSLSGKWPVFSCLVAWLPVALAARAIPIPW